MAASARRKMKGSKGRISDELTDCLTGSQRTLHYVARLLCTRQPKKEEQTRNVLDTETNTRGKEFAIFKPAENKNKHNGWCLRNLGRNNSICSNSLLLHLIEKRGEKIGWKDRSSWPGSLSLDQRLQRRIDRLSDKVVHQSQKADSVPSTANSPTVSVPGVQTLVKTISPAIPLTISTIHDQRTASSGRFQLGRNSGREEMPCKWFGGRDSTFKPPDIQR
ncbi:uncharacterized protein LOC143356857 [Halictus rubicundus]|uniref:uncharacterized protein LOC143356857 n=1 Tax=Halictus rubicundus TaxID=77578 RepID=UPI0040351BC1